MLLLVSGLARRWWALPQAKHMGHLVTPRRRGRIAPLVESGMLIAADNDCFKRLDRTAYLKMLRALTPYADHVQWVTVPDVVANADATLTRWRIWRPVLRYYGLRAAYVAQDGNEHAPPPWDELDALFIGGSTRWKYGVHAERLMREAKERGKWVHVGRAHSAMRLRYLDALGVVDSVDSTAFSRHPNSNIGRYMRIRTVYQHAMELDLCAA